ncbi:hypothetical protein E2P81_ATG00763 [Venturia nashicola]|uniref:RRM domain-containing protein n=1 Tax=Venturia nashicola TaxID=86259 RepID=A0A4Z1PA90_9PEZI|nr:hypothetical protein E6O75_ATG00781 [Venturia nashicola]TLD38220.1 hypothetical protein E2P81_ATG00763 [Venturia nashicola]
MSRIDQNRPFFLTVDYLPPSLSDWRGLKDYVRSALTVHQPGWTNVEKVNGNLVGSCSIKRREDAQSAYEALLRLQYNGQSIPVHMFDTSSGYANPINCNCPYSYLHAPHPHHTELIREGLGAKHQFERRGLEILFPPLLGNAPINVQCIPPTIDYSAYSTPTNQYASVADLMASMCNTFQNRSIGQPSYPVYQQYPVQYTFAAAPTPNYATNSSGLPVNTTNGVVKGEVHELVLGNLSQKTKDKDVEKLFSKFKFKPVSLELKKDPFTQKCKGKAIVTFSSFKHTNQVYKHFTQHKPFCHDRPVNVAFGKNEIPITTTDAAPVSDGSGSLIVDSSMYR